MVPADQESEPEALETLTSTEVITNSPQKFLMMHALRLVSPGSKRKRLKRLWDYLQAQELIAALGHSNNFVRTHSLC